MDESTEPASNPTVVGERDMTGQTAQAGPHVLLHDLPLATARQLPQARALTDGSAHWTYADVAAEIEAIASGLVRLGLQRGERVAIFLEKRFESALAPFGITAAGGVFVPINPLLKPAQVAYILRDCDVQVLITSPQRWGQLQFDLLENISLKSVILTNNAENIIVNDTNIISYSALFKRENQDENQNTTLNNTYFNENHPLRPDDAQLIDADIAAILYTSGSTGQPKGVVLSHRNLVAGAQSVASYLGNGPHDTLLAALPLSFDAGFSQLTTAFLTGARVVLLNYLLPQDVLKVMVREQVTGLTAVPPLYIQLAALKWPDAIRTYLRYFANTGGHMPRATLAQLRQKAPAAQPFLMYGLTEAFRSTYLPPDEVDKRPDSMGKAIPNAEILVLREDGSLCDADEPGELVHRGALVAQGYWNDPEKTAERFKPLPPRVRAARSGAARTSGTGLQLPEYAVFSGDTVRRDADGFLYFVGRRDEMIKTSGYRVSPVEVEELVYATGLAAECAAFGITHPVLGQVIHLAVLAHASAEDAESASASAPTPAPAPAQSALAEALLAQCRIRMPAYMVPAGIEVVSHALQRNANGKIDRQAIAADWRNRHAI